MAKENFLHLSITILVSVFVACSHSTHSVSVSVAVCSRCVCLLSDFHSTFFRRYLLPSHNLNQFRISCVNFSSSFLFPINFSHPMTRRFHIWSRTSYCQAFYDVMLSVYRSDNFIILSNEKDSLNSTFELNCVYRGHVRYSPLFPYLPPLTPSFPYVVLEGKEKTSCARFWQHVEPYQRSTSIAMHRNESLLASVHTAGVRELWLSIAQCRCHRQIFPQQRRRRWNFCHF